MRIVIIREQDHILVDAPSLPGSPPVGRAKSSMDAALGRWLRGNAERLGITIDVDPSAWDLEEERRRRELAKR